MEAPKHILAAACLVRRDDGLVAMVRTQRRGWECPGGQIEEGEDVISGLQREVLEETGLTIEVDRLVGVYSNLALPPKLMLDFVGQYRAGHLTPSPETREVAWMGPEEALQAIEHPAIGDRVRQMLAFSGRVVYRAYTLRPYDVHGEYPL